MFYLKTFEAEKLIKKLKKHPLKKDITADIRSLAWYPYKGKYLQKLDIYELKYPNLRIYYAVDKGIVIILDEEYEGLVTILGKGNKNQQNRQLNK